MQSRPRVSWHILRNLAARPASQRISGFKQILMPRRYAGAWFCDGGMAHTHARHTGPSARRGHRQVPALVGRRDTSITAARVAVVHSLRTWSQHTVPEAPSLAEKGPSHTVESSSRPGAVSGSAVAGSDRTGLRYYLRMHAVSRGSDGLPIEAAELSAEVFRMLSDTTRVRLLWALIDQELAVNELAARVGKPAPSVSQHLAKLRMARLVRTRREGTQVLYRLENEHVARLVRDGV